MTESTSDTLTKNEQFVKQELDAIRELLVTQGQFLTKDDQIHFLHYLVYCLIKLDEGQFHPDNKWKLKNMDWSPYNIREGGSSVRGTRGEILALAILNANSSDLIYKHGRGTQADEKAGVDLWCTVSDEPVQVKATDKDVTIKIESSWRGYQDINEFIIVDVAGNQLLHLHNYLTFKKGYRFTDFVSFKELVDQPEYDCEILTLP